ncbi:MAG: hypothetical protein JGK24_26570 [Microcoleus sp. PH2017_29_MFU_D_A]|uniref:hypothetical protein n=1 Tax=unclassified Microcoleus TaxID=2642155 RepID=UPI001D792F16|nr:MULTISPECIES: hypothetical protein [unclassified Microcoleus]MCC3416509.1 hypothetical protein [Microcoleus sp. PH2017_07_MST_O_A]MCC3507813.1 hypothetical protein [Microcoleus sp. PH2017_17_BER_D_A]TAE09637.1 MAG: hypothetical protein EAZ94_21465 [Oscillatoriales cyanobacterium]MCC3413090.1 hypothetical protein [Microcoleus sp. PH2017_02_FOX_O_A]MCC3452816.1 hypothetical protein [Microcoleus sp. PH2017_08_TRC_O_A]
MPELGQLLHRRLFAGKGLEMLLGGSRKGAIDLSIEAARELGLEMLLGGSRKGAIDLSIEAARELWKLTTYLLAPPADNYAGGFELETQNCF